MEKVRIKLNQGGIKYFTSWEPILSAKNFARNSRSQTQQKTSKIAVIGVFLPVTRSFFLVLLLPDNLTEERTQCLKVNVVSGQILTKLSQGNTTRSSIARATRW